ncbi:arabinan endo-1,5-alpha-L-arabinosidase [Sphingomonas sp. IC-56]|uniref:arabinan endo-1,5-alpha-L-arabinosidase n=1 Tax=Sphingomonas sp. IC-56 TaxID=2898529 RepID=UPI001E597CA1|nr:arabinan endo-1,5-alpha-L-arabinosidase [Sphingomonas sp. IC-56]MCD2323069.1 arabinan endo-1,5-alpha-L-arabinosidase [Sphingomonas sp. IC-56]
MKLLGLLSATAALALSGAAPAQQAASTGTTLNARLTGDLAPTHDPVIARDGDTYYVFGTGHGERLVETKSSKDLTHWTAGAPVFTKMPDWALKAVPGTNGMWAPDIAFVNGRWRLYYSVSTFGSNRSAIGMATNATLDPKSPNFAWRDEGLVVQSMPSDNFNAIDPNFVIDAQGRHWLSLGSFWTGIKLFELDRKTGKPLNAAKPYSIAQRPAPAGGPAPVEAPFIVPHGGFYYLLVSYDYCCKGVNSTYYTVVGRSKAITGPYLGKDGSKLMEGGGTIFLRADLQEQQRFRGPGHPGWLHDKDGRDYVVYHAYDKETRGAPTLRIAPVRWGADGWPVAEY